ncbi:hypothetical protein AUP43_15020 [Oceanibaculum pacificum]|uniref:Uncharacterized protein n=2 Tax=Oceanibaculum pacificum TaxID=580166 RepID=A0A154V8U9_9PROT|nr:hypothetical protein AUP43_15020 [Oceanibaculum pacificum]
MLVKLGLAAGIAYAAPTLLNLNAAHASPGSRGSKGSRGSRGSRGHHHGPHHGHRKGPPHGHRHHYRHSHLRGSWGSRPSRGRYFYRDRAISYGEWLELRIRL